jgi:hypothetical protein
VWEESSLLHDPDKLDYVQNFERYSLRFVFRTVVRYTRQNIEYISVLSYTYGVHDKYGVCRVDEISLFVNHVMLEVTYTLVSFDRLGGWVDTYIVRVEAGPH